MGADRERVLYDGAKKESKIVWYTSLVPHKEIAKVFEAKYPGVTVETYRADGTDPYRTGSWPRHRQSVTLRTSLKPHPAR